MPCYQKHFWNVVDCLRKLSRPGWVGVTGAGLYIWLNSFQHQIIKILGVSSKCLAMRYSFSHQMHTGACLES